MNHLFRELAPISDAAWAEIDDEATRTLTHFFAARKLVDFDGPLGYATSAVSLGRLEPLGDQPADGVTASRRQLLPLRRAAPPVHACRAPSSTRSTAAPATPTSTRSSTPAARWPWPRTRWCSTATPAPASSASSPPRRTPRRSSPTTSTATRTASPRPSPSLKAAGIGGPYAIALGPRCYAGVIETTEKGGYPLLQHLGLILGGPVVWAPAVDGAIVLSRARRRLRADRRPGHLDRLRQPTPPRTSPSSCRRPPPSSPAPPQAAIALRYPT